MVQSVMKTAEMRDIKLFDAATDKVLWKRTSVSLAEGNIPYLPLFWMCPQTDMMLCWLDQQASSIYLSSDFRSTQETTCHPLPGGYISICKYEQEEI